jgi:tungstate transport system substrate-binding protein
VRRRSFNLLTGSAMLGALHAPAVVSAQGAAQGNAQPVVWGTGSQRFSLATGSPGELGLLQALAERFTAANDAQMAWTFAGSGAAMDHLRARRVDMILAHAPPAERRAVADGWATGRVLFGSNEFWVLGPAEDPAGVQGMEALAAFRRLAERRAPFVSRGDNSGTHQKERQLWQEAGVTPDPAQLIVTRDFMTASMRRANAEAAYFLTDSSTFIAERANMPRLRVLVRGGAVLLNPYHTLFLSEPTPATPIARRFGEFLLSDTAQGMLRDFGRDRFGEPMYNDRAATAAVWQDT